MVPTPVTCVFAMFSIKYYTNTEYILYYANIIIPFFTNLVISNLQLCHTSLLLLPGQHQIALGCPTHKSRNLMRAVWLILSVQYQQKPSTDTVESQHTAWYRPQSNNKPFNVAEFVLYGIYGTRVMVLWHDTALGKILHIVIPTHHVLLVCDSFSWYCVHD